MFQANFPVGDQQILGMVRDRMRNIVQCNNVLQNNSNSRNRVVIPLIQTRSATGKENENPVRCVNRPQMANFRQTVNTENQNTSVFNRNGGVPNTSVFNRNGAVPNTSVFNRNGAIPRVSIHSSTGTSRTINRNDSATAFINTSFDPRRDSNRTRSFQTTVQDNSVSLQRYADALRAQSSNSLQNQNIEGAVNNTFNFRIFGSTENEKIFIFTGTVERVIKWNKIFRNHFCYYEVIASVISIQEGSVNTQKIMLLRDKKGPILQVVYYITTHIDIEDFHVEQVLRCIGRMSAPNILNAVSIRAATQEETETLQRLCLVCDQAVSHFLNV